MHHLFSIHCRRGRFVLPTADVDVALEAAAAYAVGTGLSVLLVAPDDREVCIIPPAIQSDLVPELLFDGFVPLPGLVQLN